MLSNYDNGKNGQQDTKNITKGLPVFSLKSA